MRVTTALIHAGAQYFAEGVWILSRQIGPEIPIDNVFDTLIRLFHLNTLSSPSLL